MLIGILNPCDVTQEKSEPREVKQTPNTPAVYCRDHTAFVFPAFWSNSFSRALNLVVRIAFLHKVFSLLMHILSLWGRVSLIIVARKSVQSHLIIL